MKLRPRWHNWYLFIWWMLSYGGCFLLFAKFFAWYLNGQHLNYLVSNMCWVHLLFWLAMYVVTEFFELIWHRVCE